MDLGQIALIEPHAALPTPPGQQQITETISRFILKYMSPGLDVQH